MAERFTYDSVSDYTLDDSDERALIEAQTECTFMWTNKEGWPAGVTSHYLFHDGCFWLSGTSERGRVKAVERDPRVAISITSKGSGLDEALTVMYRGTCEVLSDRETIDWLLPAFAERLRWGRRDEVRAEYVRLNDTPLRRALKVTPTQRVGFDGRKMMAATFAARDAGTI